LLPQHNATQNIEKQGVTRYDDVSTQHGRDMKPTDDDLVTREDGDESWARRDRQSALDWFERAVNVAQVRRDYREHVGRPVRKDEMLVEVPLDIAELILAGLTNGITEGKKLRTTRRNRMADAIAADHGRKLKAKLLKEAKLLKANGKLNATGADSAEDQAAQWACHWLLREYGRPLSPTTMKRLMQEKPR
jgi:hypothetical protein